MHSRAPGRLANGVWWLPGHGPPQERTRVGISLSVPARLGRAGRVADTPPRVRSDRPREAKIAATRSPPPAPPAALVGAAAQTGPLQPRRQLQQISDGASPLVGVDLAGRPARKRARPGPPHCKLGPGLATQCPTGGALLPYCRSAWRAWPAAGWADG